MALNELVYQGTIETLSLPKPELCSKIWQKTGDLNSNVSVGMKFALAIFHYERKQGKVYLLVLIQS